MDVMPDAKTTPDMVIDITAHRCPMTFVRTRLALDRLHPGQRLAVRLAGEEPSRSVPHTAAAQGHVIEWQEQNADGTTTVLIRKN